MPDQKKVDINWLSLAIANGVNMSNDPDRKVGAVAVSASNRQCSFGYNGLPAGVPDDGAHWAKPVKHEYCVHAEVNAVINCPFDLSGGTMYCPRKPCHRCMGVIVNCGIRRVVWVNDSMPSKHVDEKVLWDIITSSRIEYLFYHYTDLPIYIYGVYRGELNISADV